jgi:hypothetical protein
MENGTVSVERPDPMSHPNGYELLRRLVTSEKQVFIQKITDSRNRCVPTHNNGEATGSTVYWNPEHDDPVAGVECPPYIALGHELAHADQLIRGIVNAADLSGRADPQRRARAEWLNVTGTSGSSSDEDAITENDLRADNNLARRPTP